MNAIVLKFGSSVLRAGPDLRRAVHEIYAHVRRGRRVVAIASALRGETDRLLATARAMAGEPDPGAVAALLSTGEAGAAALLALALGDAGIPVELLDPAQLAWRAEGPALDAEPVGLDVARLLAALERVPVVVVPGFFALDRAGRRVLLGRGGSDLTALVVAHALGAPCVLLKDVPGVFTSDPAGGSAPPRYAALRFADAAALGARVVQDKALRWAMERGVLFRVRAVGAPGGTRVGAVRTRLGPWQPATPPLRVTLLGAGTVGGGVLTRLLGMPERLQVVAVLVRDPARHPELPAGLVTTSAAVALAQPADVVVELIGGTTDAAALVRAALGTGRHVVTANKALLAAQGPALHRFARRNAVRLLASAAVGGSVPVLEAVRRATRTAPLVALDGVLNGTCNFVLDRLAAGDTLEGAVRAAQHAGFAEADPTEDLDGSDAARKLVLVARAALGRAARRVVVRRRGIGSLEPADAAAATAAGRVWRLVAALRVQPDGLRATVAPRALPLAHPLAQVRGAGNAVLVRTTAGTTLVSGGGAGRGPTAEAVMADLLDLWRAGTRAAVAR